MKKTILLFVLLSSSLLVFCSKESPTPDPPVKTTPEPSITVPTDNSTTTTSTTSSSTSETDLPEENTTHVLDATGDLNDATEESVKNLLFGKWEFSSNAAKNNCSISFLEFTQDAYIIQLNQGENLITLTGQYSYTETEGKQIHLKNGFAPMATTIATIDGFRVEELNGELIAELNFSHFEIPAHIEGCSSPQGNYSAEKAEPVEHANFTEGATHSRLIKSWQLNAYNSTQVDSLYEFYNEFFCNYSEDESCPENIKIIVTFTTYGSYITTVQYGENPPANGGGRWEWVNEEQISLRVYPIEDETGEAYARFDIITLDDNDFVFEEYPLEEPDFKATWSFVAIQGQSIEIDLVIPDDVSTEEEGDTSEPDDEVGVYQGEVVINDITYKTVTIGEQTWLAENLNDPNHSQSFATHSDCYDRESEHCETHGRLYKWEAAVEIANSIDGWRLPSGEDREQLAITLGGEKTDNNPGYFYRGVGELLKEGGSSGMNLKFGGYASYETDRGYPPQDDVYFDFLGENGYYWSSKGETSSDGLSSALYTKVGRYDVLDFYTTATFWMHSVRLIKE